MSLVEKEFESFDGTKIWCASEGDGDSVPIVCTNGVGVSTFFWDNIRKHFSRSRKVVIWDYRGHNRSGMPKDLSHTTIEDNARDLKGVLDTMGIERACLLGHSMGCQVILEFYHMFPERVCGLVPMLGTFEHPASEFMGIKGFDKLFPYIIRIAKAAPELWGAITRKALEEPLFAITWEVVRHVILNPQLAHLEDMEPYFEHLRGLDYNLFFHMVENMQQHSAREYLSQIKAPVLVVAGEKDLFTPPDQSMEMVELIPDAELLYLKKGSHAALVEQPELINLRMEKFLTERVEPFCESN